MIKITISDFELYKYKLINKLGFLPRRITFETYITIEDMYMKILDELEIPYEIIERN